MNGLLQVLVRPAARQGIVGVLVSMGLALPAAAVSEAKLADLYHTQVLGLEEAGLSGFAPRRKTNCE